MSGEPCQGLFGRLFGHKFEAVYNTSMGPGINDLLSRITRLNGSLESTLKGGQERQYIKSVCKRCGKESSNA